MKKQLFFAALSITMLAAAQSQAAFVVSGTPISASPNFSFGGDTTTAGTSISSAAVGLAPGSTSIFGGDGVSFGDTYIASYTPGTDADNFFPSAGSLLGSTTGFGTELASGFVGGASTTYKVYVSVPATTNVNVAGSNFTVTGDGAPVVVAALNLNNAGSGADLDPGPAFVGGANNSWYLLGTVDLTAGVTYSVTQDANANSFVSQRLAGVMWEAQTGIPEPTSLALVGLGMTVLLASRRRNA